ncbi:MAG TPA: Spy/CpxP family protein refolding chaperone [Gemmatimonadaceae bacterium]|nr:Spy/CpxP family protein refolding chaperone [Gemmatimonadaceae bacterium]
MRKLQAVLVAAMLMGISTTAIAQDPQPQGGQRGGGRGNQTAMLMQGITLTAEQQTKIDSITAKFGAARRELMQDQSMDQDARRAKGREMMGKQQEELKAVLTDEQKRVFEKNVADMQARMQQGGGGRPPQR